jgi:hypothetical protein
MPLPTAPTTILPDAIGLNPGGFSTAARVRAYNNASYLFPTDGSVINLPDAWDDTQTIPIAAQRAIFVVEQAAGSTAKVIARFWQDGTYPTTGSGLPCYDGSPVEIIGIENLKNCKLISADGFAHTVNVQFFDDL